MKARFIFNPHSGSNRRNPYLRDQAEAFIKERNLDATVVATERPRHATDLAKRAVDEGCNLVIAIGGDGTMNEVGSALVDSPAAFGLIPCGSGNGLGRHLGIHKAGQGAFRTLIEGKPLAIDAGFINGFPFFCAAGMGFEALIASRFAMLTSRGFSGYLRASATAWWNYQPEHYVIKQGADSKPLEAFTLAIANSSQYGNNAYIAPDASVRDGLLDLTAVPRVNLFNAGPLVWRLFHGSIKRVATVTHLQGDKFLIERSKPGWIHTDGEPRATTANLEISIKPRSLRIMVPDGSHHGGL